MSIPIVLFIGKSGAGKTTLMEKIITELKARNYRVGTIKHHSHSGFEIDYPGKDSWRHAQAGSNYVVIAAPDRIATIRPLNHELTLDEIVVGMTDLDIILVEGYRRTGKPSIEVMRAENSKELISDPTQLIAVVADFPLDLALPQYRLDDSKKIADFIETRFLIV